MAIGLARMFSIKFPVNFNSPYKAGSIAEFWRSWHITLMRFFREYLYIPLGGNRCGKPRHYANILAVFLFSGLWHGAGWTFVAWGALHGLYCIIHAIWVDFIDRFGFKPSKFLPYRIGAIALTFVAVVCSWVLFRAHSLGEASSILSSMWGINGFTVPSNVGQAQLGLGRFFNIIGATMIPTEGAIEGLSYVWSVHGVLILLAVVWFLPNTQQLLASLNPILEKVEQPSRWQFHLTFTGGLLLALPFVLVLRTFLGTQASPFLYFNF
jgi:hypothetical protein